MHTKPINNHVDYLFRFLKQQGLVYDDVCHELADHIMCTLQDDSSVNEDNFTEKLQQFVHSARMVLLITAAKKQEEVRAGGYRGYVLHKLISLSGILQLAVFSGLLYLCFLHEAAKFIVELVYVISMLGIVWITGFKRGAKKFPSYSRLINQLWLMLLFPVAGIYIARNYMEKDNNPTLVVTAISFSVLYLMIYYAYKANINHEKKYYA